ncbi:MAG: FMN-binding protein [Tahibacter sp.]
MKMRWLATLGSTSLIAIPAAYAVQYVTLEQVKQSAFPDAEEFGEQPVLLNLEMRSALKFDADGSSGAPPKLWRASRGDATLGWLYLDEVIGKTERITYALAVDSTGAVRALEILTYRETHGAEVALPAWRRQFIGKRAGDPVHLGDDIRNISGATLSCRHISDGVHRLLQLHSRLQLAHD